MRYILILVVWQICIQFGYAQTTFTPGTIGVSQTICYNTAPATLYQVTTPTGGSGSYTYRWQRSTNNTAWSNISGATGTTYSPSALITSTWFRLNVTSGTYGTISTNTILITVNVSLKAGTIGSAQNICYNTMPSTLAELTTPTGGTGIYEYQWQNSLNNSTWTNITGANSSSYSPAALTTTTYYRRTVTSYPCGTVNSSSIRIRVYPQLTPGSIGSAQTICYNSTPAALTQITAATGGTGTYTYQWQRASDNVNWTNISGATSTGYSPSVLTNTTYFRRVVTSGSCESVYSASVLITVRNEIYPGTIASDQIICYNSSPAPLTQTTAPTGGTGTYSYQWQNSPNNSIWTNITGATSIGYTPPILTSSTYYRRNITSGTCGTVSSSSLIITINGVLTAGTIGSSQIICYNSVPEPLTQLSSPTGGLGTYTYQWQSSANNSTWANINGATDINYSPTPLTSSLYFRRVVMSGSCGAVSSASVLITVSPQITLAQLHDNMSIESNTAANFNVVVSGGTAPYTISYTRNGSAQAVISDYTSGANISTGVLTTGVYTYALTSVTDANGCIAQNLGTAITITVNGNFHYDFNYIDRSSLLANGWDFIARTASSDSRNTERTTGAVVSYDQQAHPGILRIPADVGDLWDELNNTRNTLFRDLPHGWTSIRLKISSFDPTQPYQQAGLVAYQDDNNYIQITRMLGGANNITFAREIGGSGSVLRSVTLNATTNLHFRLDRDPLTETITSYYSLDGSIWTEVGRIVQLLNNPRLAIVVGASPSGFPNADIAWAEVTGQEVAPIADELRVYPRTLVFKAVQGHSLSDTQSINIFTTFGKNIAWSQSSGVSWLSSNLQNGVTEGTIRVGVNTTGLVSGIYAGNITIESSQSNNGSVNVPVTLIIDPDIPVKATTWKDGISAAMSVSVDDGNSSGFDALQMNGFQGTFVSNGTSPPSYYTSFYNVGMELGSHLVNHSCSILLDEILRSQEIEPNISGICASTPQPCQNLITLVWPCGVTNLHEQSVSSDYYLSARGYNINQLEDATPENFMNLKCYNSHEHPPYPPSDLKTIVDMAIVQHKWFNMVLHGITNDDGAIDYAHTKDIWVTSIGNVIKYIMQRDRLVLSNYSSSPDLIVFNVTRLSITASSMKNFEGAFGPNDVTTLQVDIDDNRTIENVYVDGIINPYQLKELNGNVVLLTNVRIEPTRNKTVEIEYYNESVSRINLSTNSLAFETLEGTNPASQALAISSSVPETFIWNANAGTTAPSWLSIAPESGSGNGTINISINCEGLTPGTYNNIITVSSPGAINSPQIVNVSLKVNPVGYQHNDFIYADRSSLLADGWDFIAKSESGDSRNTEQTLGAVVSYDQQTHPGILRIPVDVGDLWADLNSTRNTLFHDLPSGWTSIRLKISAFNPTQAYQQAGLVAYQDDNNYVQICRIYQSSNAMTFAQEAGGNAIILRSVSLNAVTNLHFRLDRDPITETISSYYSLDGSVWTQVGSVVQVLNNPRLSIVVGASPNGFPIADIAWVEIYANNLKSTNNGIGLNSKLEVSEVVSPIENKLYHNYPNPFKTNTWIEYDLAEDSHVTLEIYNSMGQKVETILSQYQRADGYRIIWNSNNYPPGVYYLRMKAGTFTDTIRMLLSD
jgi:hypothetical protein